ncbi:hypothetical protein SDC9_40610 [bioreactor metagenome]|uniref:ADP-ribosyl cyclase/cyclic ADP-ribose hydrolase n=1 Tax=bioreactor metagenome TaxID=1076179 RepID=A0A644VSZ9_9ZZZZ|nr:toll/interleukin-1 receptor domain-containing protein [Methanobrevibacter sp.]MEA4957142.1 toll/interleukin-1 receptor domain-containing protein [Methanobrevibacter sp.]
MEKDLYKKYDVFISHSSEDKEFTNNLAKKLKGCGFNVWYDDFVIQIGNNIRKTISEGIKNSQFGIIVLSNSFMESDWANHEYDGLMTLLREEEYILPIWHNISLNEVKNFDPSFSNIKALSTEKHTIDEIIEAIEIRISEKKSKDINHTPTMQKIDNYDSSNDTNLKKYPEKNNNSKDINIKEKQQVLLDLYDVLHTHKKSLQKLEYNLVDKDNPYNVMFSIADDGKKIKNEQNNIFFSKLHVYVYLEKIMNEIKIYFYIPKYIKKDIENYVNFIENKILNTSGTNKTKVDLILSSLIKKITNSKIKSIDENEKIMLKLIWKVYWSESSKDLEYLNKIYEDIEKELEVKMH